MASEVEQLLKLSILYHRLLSDFEQVIGRSLTQRERSQAFQLISDCYDNAHACLTRYFAETGTQIKPDAQQLLPLANAQQVNTSER